MFQDREPYMRYLMELLPDKAYHITVDGGIEEISPDNGKEFRLDEAQNLVGGFIEIVYLSKQQIMVVNEEGKYDKANNVIATGIADLHGALWIGDYICGDVVVCPSSMLA